MMIFLPASRAHSHPLIHIMCTDAPLQVAGVFTNLFGGVAGSKYGLRFTLLSSLVLQVSSHRFRHVYRFSSFHPAYRYEYPHASCFIPSTISISHVKIASSMLHVVKVETWNVKRFVVEFLSLPELLHHRGPLN